MGASGTSMQFEDLRGRYLLFLTDGKWHGTDYIKQLDVLVK
jgi:hypothetical protein